MSVPFPTGFCFITFESNGSLSFGSISDTNEGGYTKQIFDIDKRFFMLEEDATYDFHS